MNRRSFISTVPAALLLSPVAFSFTGAQKSHYVGLDYLFYDDRFPEAESRANKSTFSHLAVAVQSDVTSLWFDKLKIVSQQSNLVIVGVTTQSFYFCLKTLMQEHTHVEASESRISQDMYVWTISSLK